MNDRRVHRHVRLFRFDHTVCNDKEIEFISNVQTASHLSILNSLHVTRQAILLSDAGEASTYFSGTSVPVIIA
jgi:hypothetical protein